MHLEFWYDKIAGMPITSAVMIKTFFFQKIMLLKLCVSECVCQ